VWLVSPFLWGVLGCQPAVNSPVSEAGGGESQSTAPPVERDATPIPDQEASGSGEVWKWSLEEFSDPARGIELLKTAFTEKFGEVEQAQERQTVEGQLGIIRLIEMDLKSGTGADLRNSATRLNALGVSFESEKMVMQRALSDLADERELKELSDWNAEVGKLKDEVLATVEKEVPEPLVLEAFMIRGMALERKAPDTLSNPMEEAGRKKLKTLGEQLAVMIQYSEAKEGGVTKALEDAARKLAALRPEYPLLAENLISELTEDPIINVRKRQAEITSKLVKIERANRAEILGVIELIEAQTEGGWDESETISIKLKTPLNKLLKMTDFLESDRPIYVLYEADSSLQFGHPDWEHQYMRLRDQLLRAASASLCGDLWDGAADKTLSATEIYMKSVEIMDESVPLPRIARFLREIDKVFKLSRTANPEWLFEATQACRYLMSAESCETAGDAFGAWRNYQSALSYSSNLEYFGLATRAERDLAELLKTHPELKDPVSNHILRRLEGLGSDMESIKESIKTLEKASG
jgi:hypothetical protein